MAKRKTTQEPWTCPRCGLEGDRLKSPDPKRCLQCCRIDAADDLYAALKDLDALYASAWDLVEPSGAVTFFPETVAQFERLHAAADAALRRARGEE